MKITADFHVHSKFSRATAGDLDLEHIYAAAWIKGIQVVGTGDFCHPAWFAEIEAKQRQWAAFLRRSSPEGLPADLGEVIDGIVAFLTPILSHLAADKPVPRIWTAAGPWQM